MREPTDITSVERKGPDKFFCSMCTCKFDKEAFELADGCPGCQHMADQQAKRNQRGLRGAL